MFVDYLLGAHEEGGRVLLESPEADMILRLNNGAERVSLPEIIRLAGALCALNASPKATA